MVVKVDVVETPPVVKNSEVDENPNKGNESENDEGEELPSSADDENEIEMKDETTELRDDIKSKNENLLSHFWKLANLDEGVRSEAVVCLLKELEKTRKEDEINYTVQRLVKGLSSSRKAARQGFATALTHVLNMFTEVTSDNVLDLMSKHLAVQGNFKGQEESEAYFGQVFGILAICRSKLHAGENSNMHLELVKKLTEKLLSLMKKKSYLGEICAIAICDNILKRIDYAVFESIKPLLNTVLMQGWKKCSPEDLMITLTVQSKFKDDLSAKYFKQHWNRSQILHESNFKDLSRVLMDTTNTAHPRVHVLCDLVLDYLFSHAKDNSGMFEKFWKVIVEDGLMHSTHERKFLVMNVILKVASWLSSDQVDVVFGESIIRCIINSCQSKINYLYNSVQNMLDKLPEKLSENEDSKVISSVIKRLVGSHGHVAFDSITKKKTVEELASKLSHDLPAYFDWLKDVFNAGTTDLDNITETSDIPEKDGKECRTWVADQLISLLRVCKTKNEESLLMDITYFLFFHAYFDGIKKSKKESILKVVPACSVNDATHQFYRLRFNTALTELANIFHTKAQDENKSPIGGIAEDGELYAWKILCFAKRLLEMPDYAQLVVVWTPEVYESWNSSLEKISAMQAESDKSEGVFSTGTQLLFVHTTLQLFVNREEAVDILQELEVCYEKSKEKKRKKKTEPHWTEVLTEILLGFMAQSSHLMRQIVDLVYPTLIPHLTEDALDLLIKAIKPAKQGKGDGIEFLSDIEEDNEEEEEVQNGKPNENEDEDKEEEEEEDKDKDKEEDKENEEESDSDTDSEDSDDDEDFEIDEAFKTELKAALGDAAVNDEDDDDEDEDEEEEEEEEDIDMDTCKPEQLKAMDQALAEVFKSRNQKQMEKKKKKDKKLSIIHFKLRVLDLIEIFIKKQPKDRKILLFLEPLYEVINASNLQSDEQPLFERTLGIIKNKLCTLHEYPSGKELDVEAVHLQIERLIQLARTAPSALLVEYITQGIIYLIRVLRGNPELKEPSPRRTRSKRTQKETVIKEEPKASHESVGCLDEQRLIGCYTTALTEFMTKKSSHLQPVLFNKLIQRFPYLGWRLAAELPKYLNTGCNNFRKVKAVEMLKLLFSNKAENVQTVLLQVHKEISTNIMTAFQATTQDGYSLKARQFHQIVQLSDTFIKEISKYPDVFKEVDRKGIKESLSEALDSSVVTRSPSLQSYCKKILSSLENTHVQENVAKKKKKKTLSCN